MTPKTHYRVQGNAGLCHPYRQRVRLTRDQAQVDCKTCRKMIKPPQFNGVCQPNHLKGKWSAIWEIFRPGLSSIYVHDTLPIPTYASKEVAEEYAKGNPPYA